MLLPTTRGQQWAFSLRERSCLQGQSCIQTCINKSVSGKDRKIVLSHCMQHNIHVSIEWAKRMLMKMKMKITLQKICFSNGYKTWHYNTNCKLLCAAVSGENRVKGRKGHLQLTGNALCCLRVIVFLWVTRQNDDSVGTREIGWSSAGSAQGQESTHTDGHTQSKPKHIWPKLCGTGL